MSLICVVQVAADSLSVIISSIFSAGHSFSHGQASSAIAASLGVSGLEFRIRKESACALLTRQGGALQAAANVGSLADKSPTAYVHQSQSELGRC